MVITRKTNIDSNIIVPHTNAKLLNSLAQSALKLVDDVFLFLFIPTG